MRNPTERLLRVVESESFYATADEIIKNADDPLTTAKCAEIASHREPGGRYYQAKLWAKAVSLIKASENRNGLLRSICTQLGVKPARTNALAFQGQMINAVERKSKFASQALRKLPVAAFDHALRQKEKAPEYLRHAVAVMKQSPTATVTTIHNRWCENNGSIKENLDIIKPSDWWAFGRPKWRQEENFPGSIPGEIYANALYYFAPQKGIAVDPMAGSGMLKRVHSDRKLWQKNSNFELKVYLFDLHPKKSFIKKHDATKPLPIKADWIFLDPPYFGQSNHLYDGKLAQASNYDGYISAIREIIFAMAKSLSPKGRLCIFVPKWSGQNQSNPNHDVPADVAAIAKAAGLRWIDAAFVSRGRQQEPGSATKNNSAKSKRRMRSDTCVLNVFEK